MIDLHMHSNLSLDGELTARQLIDLCKEKGLKTIAITDHNNCDAFTSISEYAAKEGLTLIPGIEIDCLFKETHLHLLAYGISPESSTLQALCKRQYALEEAASLERIKAINQLGFELDINDFDHLESSVITPEDIAEVLLFHKDLPRHPLLLPYRKDGMRSDNPLVNFYWDYYSKGKPCYLALAYPSIESVIQLIHDAGGYAVLAHPGITFRQELALINEIIALSIDGLEVFSSYHSQIEVVTLYELAKEHRLMITAGSDFHGKIKPSVKIGSIDYHHLDVNILSQIDPLISKINQ